MFEVTRPTDETVLYRVINGLDHKNSDAFKIQYEADLEKGVRNFVIDLSKATDITKVDIGAFFVLYRRLGELEGGEIIFTNLTEEIEMIFQQWRMDRVFRIKASVDAALNEFRPK